jgi:uncharacterized protein with PQ loop repeat
MPHSDYYIHAKQLRSKLNKKKMTPLDTIVMLVSVAYPLSALPQAIQVLQGNASGVSIVSWMSFLVCAALFLAYGLKNRVPPMIISNTLWIVMDSLVVIGIIADKVV